MDIEVTDVTEGLPDQLVIGAEIALDMIPTGRICLKDLKADGWKEVSGVATESHPQCGAIVLTKGGRYIRHMYSVYEDTSDYPGDDSRVEWEEVEIYTETIKRARPVRKQGD